MVAVTPVGRTGCACKFFRKYNGTGWDFAVRSGVAATGGAATSLRNFFNAGGVARAPIVSGEANPATFHRPGENAVRQSRLAMQPMV
jgi:hypothetical protein